MLESEWKPAAQDCVLHGGLPPKAVLRNFIRYLFKHLPYNKPSQFVCYHSVAKLCTTPLQSHGLKLTRLLCPRGFPGKNTGVGCHALLQGIFPTQGSNLCLLHWQADSSLLSQLSREAHWQIGMTVCKIKLFEEGGMLLWRPRTWAQIHTLAIEPLTQTSWETISHVFYLWWITKVCTS